MKQNRHNQVLRFVLVSIGLWFVLVLCSPPNVALAKTNCREIARDTQEELVTSGNEKQLKTASNEEILDHYTEVFSGTFIAYPECESELKILWDWNSTGDPNKPFPFPKSEDPKTYALGPVSWWWDTIYNRLLGGNTLLMIFFGWELFLMPFPMIIGVLVFIFTAPFGLVKQFIESRRHKK